MLPGREIGIPGIRNRMTRTRRRVVAVPLLLGMLLGWTCAAIAQPGNSVPDKSTGEQSYALLDGPPPIEIASPKLALVGQPAALSVTVSKERPAASVRLEVRDLESGARAVAARGSGQAQWGADGNTLFYTAGDELLAAAVTFEPALSIAAPRTLFTMPARARFPNHDLSLSADDSWLLVTTEASSGADQEYERGRLQVVLHWARILQDRVQPR